MFARCAYKDQLGKISMLAAVAEQLDNPDVNNAIIAMKWSWPVRNTSKLIKGQLAKPGKKVVVTTVFRVCTLV